MPTGDPPAGVGQERDEELLPEKSRRRLPDLAPLLEPEDRLSH